MEHLNEEIVNYEVEIKIEICKIFDKLLDMREDFLINNVI